MAEPVERSDLPDPRSPAARRESAIRTIINDRDRAIDEVAAVRSAIMRIHVRGADYVAPRLGFEARDLCLADGETWPCPTVRALSPTQPAESVVAALPDVVGAPEPERVYVALGNAVEVDHWRREAGIPPRQVVRAWTNTKALWGLRGPVEVLTFPSWADAPPRIRIEVEQQLAIIRAKTPRDAAERPGEAGSKTASKSVEAPETSDTPALPEEYHRVPLQD